MQERRIEDFLPLTTIVQMLKQLKLWMDEIARDGPTNMAVDEWLLANSREPILRIYRWAADWGSYGYFVPDQEAANSLRGLRRVRRWTGGGIVDHRKDWTYTLVLPRGETLAEVRGAESYRVIHLALAYALRVEGIECDVSPNTSASPGGDCFKKAVEYDLLDDQGCKLAGAGQRRTSDGLLHQGSLALNVNPGLARRFGERLATQLVEDEVKLDAGKLSESIARRYANTDWQLRR